MTATAVLQSCRIGFIGAGNMAGSLIRGLLANGVDGNRLWAADIDPSRLRQLALECSINVDDSPAVAGQSDVLVLAVKPQSMHEACEQVRTAVAASRALVVSIAAGITIGHLQAWLGKETALVRCMPNTPALVGKGATALFAGNNVTENQQSLADAILSAVGLTVWLDSEDKIDAVTALSGSGPAYFFLLMECMQDVALKLGLDSETARQLVYQTALGAALLADSSKLSTAELRRQVTSPGGTTEQAILQFEAGGMRELVEKALTAACNRSRELARNLGD